jgi:hypothetical protein
LYYLLRIDVYTIEIMEVITARDAILGVLGDNDWDAGKVHPTC